MSSSRRCPACKVDWPNDQEYARCPECLRVTFVMPCQSIALAVARSRKAHADFERFYQEREAERVPARVDELIAQATAVPVPHVSEGQVFGD